MIPNIAFYVVPVALGRTREKLDEVFASWAEMRQVSTMAMRISGPIAIPGKDYEVWVFETTLQNYILLMSDISRKVRAAIALRLNGGADLYHCSETPVRGIAHLHSRDKAYYEYEYAERLEDLETLVGRALIRFEGPLDVAPGWLEPWLGAHVSSAEVRVLRWGGSRTKLRSWPAHYGNPETDWRQYDGLVHDTPGRPRTCC